MNIDPIDDPTNYKFGVFYCNKNDIRTVVPKRSRFFGYTLNFAIWKSYVFIFAIIASMVISYIVSNS
jgi:uncharacterized membrane protein